MSAAGQFDLTMVRKEVLVAAVARILPSDDGAGAAEAGVAEYIAGALGEPTHRHLGRLFERGLDFLQLLSEERNGKDFVACSGDEQDQVLGEAQSFPNNDARRFFEVLILLSLEGFLSDPRHGGNRDGQGWRYLGYVCEGAQLQPCVKQT